MNSTYNELLLLSKEEIITYKNLISHIIKYKNSTIDKRK